MIMALGYTQEVLFPACAGVIPISLPLWSGPGTFPRVCGGDPYELRDMAQVADFSPRVRG